MAAFAITAPAGSVTVPVMVPQSLQHRRQVSRLDVPADGPGFLSGFNQSAHPVLIAFAHRYDFRQALGRESARFGQRGGVLSLVPQQADALRLNQNGKLLQW